MEHLLETTKTISNSIAVADQFVNRNYMIGIEEQRVYPLDEKIKNSSYIRLFKIEKFVYDKNENINDKLISVYGSLQNVGSTAILLIQGTSDAVTFYIGVRTSQAGNPAHKILGTIYEGNFPGSIITPLKNKDISELMDGVIQSKYYNSARNISCVNVIPSFRNEDKEKFVQGIEKFVDTMGNREYSVIILAKPISKQALERQKRGYEGVHSSLSPYRNRSIAYGENESLAVTKGMAENFSETVNKSISNTTGKNEGKNSSTAETNPDWFIGSTTNTEGYSYGESWSEAVTNGKSITEGTTRNSSDTDTKGSSKTITVEHMNRSVTALQEKIDEQLSRIKECEGYGMWECAAYFLADDISVSVSAANTYKALMLGNESSAENSFVSVWDGIRNSSAYDILDYLRCGLHPVIEVKTGETFDEQLVTPACFVSGKELPLLMGMPHKSVSGLTVSSTAEFGRNVYTKSNNKDKKSIRLGQVYHMGKEEGTEVSLNLNSFTSHCFVTGSTGSGKSNTTYGLLERFIENEIPFLVIEPAKGEYKDAFSKVKDINIFSTNPLIGQMLKINPFRFDEKIHILEHLDRLIEIFNACWEMYAAMPAILKDSVEQAYIEKGWDLLNSTFLGDGSPVYPTFHDLMEILPKVINSSDYSAEAKGNYTGSLVTRVRSLSNGISGQIFCDCYDIPDETIFDKNTIVDLSRVGSSETKSLIMGLLVLKLSEYRMAHAESANSELRHITVMEEAHNLLKRTQPGQGGSTVVAKSVEMICNSIAEMRTYGEGFIIVDQSPTAVDIAAIKNTNTKIIMRLPEKEDCEAVGHSVGLNEEQIKEIAKLEMGVAVVMQNNWLEAVLTKIDKCSDAYEEMLEKITLEACNRLRGALITELISQYRQYRKYKNNESISFDRGKLYEVINRAEISRYKKSEMLCCVDYVIDNFKTKNIRKFADILMNLSGAKGLFLANRESLLKAKSSADVYKQESVLQWKTTMIAKLNEFLYMEDKGDLLKYLVISEKYLAKGKKAEINYGIILDIIK